MSSLGFYYFKDFYGIVSSHFEAKRKLFRCERLFLLGIPARQSSMLSLWVCVLFFFEGEGAHYLCRVCLGVVCVFNLIGCVSMVREVSVGYMRCMVGG